QDRLWGFEEAENCRTYWQNEDHYQQFAVIVDSEDTSLNNIDYFNKEEIDFFKKWQLVPYDKNNPEHVRAKNYIMDTVWEKSIHLVNLINSNLEGFETEAKKIWHKLGSKDEGDHRVHAMQFKFYTWAKLYRKRDSGKQIYFTFGLDVRPEREAL